MVLPTFVIVGAQKAGTTSLWKVVASHPDVARPNRKEVHFFDRKFDNGVEWYSGLFTLKPGQTQAGESTPIYMYDPVVRQRMIDTLPDVVPIVDRAPIRGLTIATGMSGHGFGIGPGMGRVVADLVTGGAVGHDLTRFRLARFSDGSRIAPGPSL